MTDIPFPMPGDWDGLRQIPLAYDHPVAGWGSICSQTWRDGNDGLRGCELQRGHSGECQSEGTKYSDTMETL